MKKVIIIIIAAVLVLAGGATFGTVYNQPENVAIRSFADAFDELLSRDELSVVESVVDGGSVSFDLDEVTHLVEEENEYASDETLFGANGETLIGKLYISPDELFLKNFEYYDGNIDIIGEAYVSDSLIYVNETETFYASVGIEIDNLKKQLEDSIFAYDSGSKYSLKKLTDMTEDEYEKLLDSLDTSDDKTELAKDARDLLEHIVKSAWDVIKANAEFESEIANVSVGAHKKSARLITMTVDVDAMKLIIEEFCTEVLAEDKKIEKFIKKYEDTLSKLDLYDEDEYTSFLEYYSGEIEEIRVNKVYEIEARLDSVNYEAVKVELITPIVNSNLLKLTVDLIYENEDTGKITDEEIFLLDCGPEGIKDSGDIRIACGDTDIRYIVSQNDSDAFICKLYQNGEKMLEFKNNKVTNKFALVFSVKDVNSYEVTEREILGSIEQDNDVYNIKVTKYIESLWFYDRDKLLEVNEYKLDLKLYVSTDDEMPDTPTDYVTIDEIEELDIKAWKTKLENMSRDTGY